MKLSLSLALGVVALPAALAAQQFPTRPPAPGPITPAQFPPYQEATLPNGVRLVLVEQHKQPVVSISLSLPAGSIYDAVGKEGTADLVAGLLTKGAGSRSAEEFASAIEGAGGSINAAAGPDFFTVRADVLTPSAALAFEMLADAAIRPQFPASEIELLRKQTLSGLQLELSQPASVAARFLAQGLYGSNPYGRQVTPASVRAIARDDLVAFQSARLRPKGALLVVAGDLSLPDAKKLATQYFGEWSGAPGAPAPVAATPPRAGSEIVLVNRPGSVQSNVVVGNTTFAPNDPRWFAAVVANQILGGASDSRLFLILREKKGWTYGAYSSLRRPRGVGHFEATVEVRTAATDSALSGLLSELRRIRTEPPSATELQAAKGALVGSFPLSIETADQIAGSVSQSILLGLPKDYLQTYRTKLSRVTPAQVSAAAKAIVRPDSALIVVVGDAVALYPRLKAIAPVRIVTVEGKPVAPAELTAVAAPVALDASKLTASSDSFSVLVQGNPLGWQRTQLTRDSAGWHYAEDIQIASFVQQHTDLTFDDKLQMRSVQATGQVQGQPVKTEVSYAGGRAKGSASAPTAQGIKTLAIDTTMAAGTLDENAITPLIPALAWAPDAKWVIPVFSTTTGGTQQLTLAVTGTESVTVPAGTFDAYHAELTGGQQPLTLWVTTAEPHRLVKMAFAGQPVEIVLVK